MDIKKLIKDAHDNAVEKGFYDCPECGGDGFVGPEDRHGIICPTCKGSKINPNKNIGELLCLISGELTGEALESHRNGRFAELKAYESNIKEFPEDQKHFYLYYMKDRFEDEISDVFIRLFDLCGYLRIGIKWNGADENTGNIGQTLYRISRLLPSDKVAYMPFSYNGFFSAMINFCKWQKIDIEKHITAKMAYNKTRPYKHGKKY